VGSLAADRQLTIPELLILLLALAIVIRACPKSGPKKKKRRKSFIARTGHIKLGALWTRNRTPTPENIAYAMQCAEQNRQQSRHAQPTIVMNESLVALRVRFWQEEITWHHGTKFVLSDWWLPDLKIAIEANGYQHRFERTRDAEKAEIIFHSRGFKTIEFWNGEILRPGFQDRLRRELGL
jgi:very-short-patch-repair endonuclease